MKFSAAILLSVLSASTLVSAVPTWYSRRGAAGKTRGKKMMNFATDGNSAGAAFFINNDPKENQIIISSINADGSLVINSAVSTSGRGAHGLGSDGADPLFSQGAIKASQKAGLLASVNPGSNTISVFKINQNDPTDIQLLGEPVGSGGEFPISVAFNPDGTQLCALNGGEVNGVQCFSFKDDLVAPLSGTNRGLSLNQTTPATGPGGSASHLLFSEDGKSLIASVKGTGPDQGGFLAVWDVAVDGSLSKEFKKLNPPKGAGLPFGMALVPGKNAVVVTDPAVGFTIYNLANGEASAVKVDGQTAVCWAAFSKQTGSFFLTDIGTSLITEIVVDDQLQGSIVRQIQQTKGSSTIDDDIATVNGNDILFVLAADAGKIDTLRLTAKGKSENVNALDVKGPATAAGVAFDGKNIQGLTTFLTNAGGNNNNNNNQNNNNGNNNQNNQNQNNQDKAAQDKAAQDKAAQDKAAQDKAAQDKAAQDKNADAAKKD